MAGASRVARGVLIGLGLAAYAVLAHLSNAAPGHGGLGALLSILPVGLAALALALKARRRALPLALLASVVIAIALAWPWLELHYSVLYVIQEAGLYGALAAVFARSLAPGREPLCAYFASRVHGPLGPELARYTRSVTLAWAWFFVALAATIVALFLLLPLPRWSVFTNFCALPLVGLMFAAEYAVRRHALPTLEHRGLLVTLRAVFGSGWRPALAAPRH